MTWGFYLSYNHNLIYHYAELYDALSIPPYISNFDPELPEPHLGPTNRSFAILATTSPYIYTYIYIYYIMHIRIYRYIMRSNLFVFLFFLHLHQHSFGFAMVLTCFDPYPYRPCQCSMIQPGKDRAVAAAIHHSHLCRECRGLNMFHHKKNIGNLIPLKFRLP